MSELNTALLGQACSIFMELAYPAGPATIPLKKRAYYSMDAARPLADYLPPSPIAGGIAQELSTRKDGPKGYEFRLGSCHFPHLKLRVQLMEHGGSSVWVFTVDTHDSFSRSCPQPPADHPDALHRSWSALANPNAGELLVSPPSGVELTDLAGRSHLGGGSHGSLEAGDSEVPILTVGLEAEPRRIVDLAPLALRHFGVKPPAYDA